MNLEQLDKEVSKEALKIKATISGISHSGKTWTALRIAKSLADGDWTKIMAVDIGERNGVNGFDHLGKFRTIKLPSPFTMDKIISCIDYSISKGHKVIIFDSLTQFWSGSGGILEQVELLGGKNPWSKLTPLMRKAMLYMLDANIHIICTLRQKSDKVQDVDDNGKKIMKKVGTKDDFKPDSDYDFDLCIEMNREHLLIAHKDRTHAFPDNAWCQYSDEHGQAIREYCQAGTDIIGDYIKEAERLGIIEGKKVAKDAFDFVFADKSKAKKLLKLFYSEKDLTTGKRTWVKVNDSSK